MVRAERTMAEHHPEMVGGSLISRRIARLVALWCCREELLEVSAGKPGLAGCIAKGQGMAAGFEDFVGPAKLRRNQLQLAIDQRAGIMKGETSEKKGEQDRSSLQQAALEQNIGLHEQGHQPGNDDYKADRRQDSVNVAGRLDLSNLRISAGKSTHWITPDSTGMDGSFVRVRLLPVRNDIAALLNRVHIGAVQVAGSFVGVDGINREVTQELMT